jgi:hypothetical protein
VIVKATLLLAQTANDVCVRAAGTVVANAAARSGAAAVAAIKASDINAVQPSLLSPVTYTAAAAGCTFKRKYCSYHLLCATAAAAAATLVAAVAAVAAAAHAHTLSKTIHTMKLPLLITAVAYTLMNT